MIVTTDEVIVKTHTYFVTVKEGKYVEVDEPYNWGLHDDLWFWNENLQINTHIIVLHGEETEFIDSDGECICHICDLCNIGNDDEQTSYQMIATVVAKYY